MAAARKKARRPASAPRKRSRGRTAVVKVGPLMSTMIVVAILLLIAAFLACPYIKVRVNDTGAAVPVLAMNTGGFAIDISHYQGEVVWDSLLVLVDGKGRTIRDIVAAREVRRVEYAFIKATEGESMADEAFGRYWDGAGGSAVIRGAYHFFRSSKDPLKQAQNFIRTVGPLTSGDLPPVLDVETMHKGCTKKQLNDGVKAWLDAVEAHYKRRPIVYANDSYIRDILSPEITSNYPVWVAHYSVDAPQAGNWAAWQFTDRAVVHGAEGKVDLSCTAF